jgi:CRISPR system Cascade subunit CasD
MARHLMLHLSAPLLAYGGETIDNFGVIRDFPALSMLTGLIANALGWDRGDADQHDRLQARLRVGSRIEQPGSRLTEYQTAKLNEDDHGWTTRGRLEGRAPSPSYSRGDDGRKSLTLQRYRDFHADMSSLVALRLVSAEEAPTLDDIAHALDKPCRPLFIGRKPCVPSARLVLGFAEADHVLGALLTWPALTLKSGETARAQWPDGEGELPNARMLELCDERNWRSGLHGGWRPVREGSLTLQRVAA